MIPEQSQTWSLTARWVFPVDGPPLPSGVVTVGGERIVRVESGGETQADLDLGNVAILPGFVNAHTHLDLTDLHGKCPPTPDFTGWLRKVIDHRRRQTPEQVRADIRAGLAQCLRHGVTLLGDISAGGASWEVLDGAAIRAVVFYELLGLTAERAELSWQNASAWHQAHPDSATCRAGLSPHAPYSVRDSLFARVGTTESRIPVAIHLAESTEEMALLHRQNGPFVDFLRDMGVWDPQGLVPDIPALLDLYRDRNPLWIHGNYLDPEMPHLRTGTVVYCPRTHAAFQHPPHPFLQMRRLKVPLALGTDSLASNPDLSILEEIRFLHRFYPDLDGAWLLDLATRAGARALGWEQETGSLSPGKSADLVVLPLPDREEKDPHLLVLESSLPAQQVLFRGRWIEDRWGSSSDTG
jgi:aminodeoxyfutalosine deaminase